MSPWAISLLQSLDNYLIFYVFANASVIRDLKREYRERADYETEKENENWWIVRPVSFNKYHKEMLGHSQLLVQKGLVAISPRFSKKLIDARRLWYPSLQLEPTSF